LAFSPSNSDNIPVVSGEKLPDTGVPVTLVSVEMFGNPPSSSSIVRQIFSLVPPRRFMNVTVGDPSGGVSLKIRSPTKVWSTAALTLPAVASHVPPVSNRKLRSVTVPTPLTGKLIFTPAGLLSGIDTGGPV
jgi:hypothetical protein